MQEAIALALKRGQPAIVAKAAGLNVTCALHCARHASAGLGEVSTLSEALHTVEKLFLTDSERLLQRQARTHQYMLRGRLFWSGICSLM